MSLPLAAYTRVSRIGDRKDTLMSHDQQRQKILAFACAKGFTVEVMPEESDVSGGKSDRPVLGDVLRGIEDGRYAGVIVAELGRLSRMDIVDGLKVIRRIEDELGGKVISVNEAFDVSTPEGEFSRNVNLGVANMQLRRYQLQFRASKRRAVDAGVWPFPVVPKGYRVTRRKDGGDGRLRLGPPGEVGQVRRAFEARAGGASWREVGRILGCSPSAAARIIENRAYVGEIRLEAGEETWINAGAHEPLVDRALWEAAQIAHPRPTRNGATTGALLAGIVRCAGCSCSMTADTARRRPYYRCRAYARANATCSAPAMAALHALDEYVERLVLPHIESLEFSAVERHRAVEDALAALEAAERELEDFQSVTRGIAPEFLASGIRERVERVKQARRRLGEARLAATPLPEADTLRERWSSMTVDQKRHVLRGALGAVVVGKGRGLGPERVKVIACGFEPADLPRRHGRRRVVPRPFEWVDDMPGEVRPLEAEDIEQRASSAST